MKRGELVLTIGTGRDITRLVDLEKKMKQSEEVISEYSDKIHQLETRFGLGNIIYSSDKIYHIMQLALKVAITDSPVMILGETGVGKEMVASFIHQSSTRSNKPPCRHQLLRPSPKNFWNLSSSAMRKDLLPGLRRPVRKACWKKPTAVRFSWMKSENCR